MGLSVMAVKKFKATLGAEDPGSLFFEVPFDVKAEYGRARPPVLVSINGYSFRTTIAVYGGRSYVGVRREHREGAKVAVGDVVNVTIAPDKEPRVVAPPAELAAALAKNAKAKSAWSKLSYSCQKEHADAVAGAKRPETRARRVKDALTKILAKS